MSDFHHIVCPHCHKTNRVPSSKDSLLAKCGHCKRDIFDGFPATLNEGNLDSHLNNSDIPVIVDFWAEWCGPCKSMAPVFVQATKKMQPLIQFSKIDTDENQRLMARFNIRGIPTLIIFKDGQEVARRSGAIPATELQDWIQEYL